jgi:hypothetical protein
MSPKFSLYGLEERGDEYMKKIKLTKEVKPFSYSIFVCDDGGFVAFCFNIPQPTMVLFFHKAVLLFFAKGTPKAVQDVLIKSIQKRLKVRSYVLGESKWLENGRYGSRRILEGAIRVPIVYGALKMYEKW